MTDAIADTIEVHDELFGVVRTVMEGYAETLVGYPIDVRWPRVSEPAVPNNERVWARVSTQVVLSRKVSFVAEGTGGRDKNKYEVSGLIFVQLFMPKTPPEAGEHGEKIARALVSAFRKHRGSTTLRFFNARFTDLPPETNFHRINVVSEIEYDEYD